MAASSESATTATAADAVDIHDKLDRLGHGPVTIEASLPEILELSEEYRRKHLG